MLLKGEIELFAKKNKYIALYNENPCIADDILVISDHEVFINFLNEWMEDFADTPLIEDKEPVKEPSKEPIKEEPIKVPEPEDESESEIEEDESIYFPKIVEAYKIIRNHNVVNGWEIEKAFSAYCFRSNISMEQAIEGFKAIYQSEYDEKRTVRLLENTKKKDLKLLPNLGRVYHHILEALNSNYLNDNEKELLETLLDDLQEHGYSNYQLPDYLKNAEDIYLYKSSLHFGKDKKHYYKESYFIEQNIDGTKQVVYVNITTSHYKGIYKPHKLEQEKKVGIKAEVVRGIKVGQFEDYEYLLNDKIPYKPSFNFTKVDDIVHEIGLISMKFSKFFDISLYKQYLDIKTAKYRKENNDPPPCIINKNTGWSDDLRFFYHYALNDNYHELHSDHVLYKLNKDLVIEKDKQHELVKAILQEGKLLAVLLTSSAASLVLKPFKIPGVTYVVSGNPGAGKTLSALIATSLFYFSDDHLMDAQTTKTGLELMIASMNSLPVLIDEAALLGVNYTLQDLIFMVSSGKGKTRGKKDLSLDFKHLKSNVFWTTETTDIDDLRRSGAFRRMLYIVAKAWNDFTSLFDAKERINEKFAGCGVDYIKFLIEHMEDVQKAFKEQTKGLLNEYGDIAIIVLNLYGGLTLLEAYYNTKFNALRKTINKLLREAKTSL
jgi:Superfamily II helicase and inactivated derivatives